MRCACPCCPHPLEAGLLIHRLQRLLGHQDIHSTLRYVHWVPNDQEGNGGAELDAHLHRATHPLGPAPCLAHLPATRFDNLLPPPYNSLWIEERFTCPNLRLGSGFVQQTFVRHAALRTTDKCVSVGYRIELEASDYGPQTSVRHLGAGKPLRAVRRPVEPPGRAAVSLVAGNSGRAKVARRGMRYRRAVRGDRGPLLAVFGCRRRAFGGNSEDCAREPRGPGDALPGQRDGNPAR